jgi:outer membrane protein, heavy metal efflux system
MLNHSPRQLLSVVLLIAAGCASYRPMPLTQSSVERALTPPPIPQLEARTSDLPHRLLPAVPIDLQEGVTPDAAAVIAVLANPALRADRNRLALSNAQLLQAGLLPNPQLTVENDFVTGGPGLINPFVVGLGWDITTLITHDLKVRSAQANQASIRLDVAWVEWQTAEAAKAAVFDQVSLQKQLAQAREVDQWLADNAKLLRAAVERHEKTVLDLAAAQAASQTAHADALAIQQQLDHQRLVLLRAIGLPANVRLPLRKDIELPSQLHLPTAGELVSGLESTRLDLIALRQGYAAQELSVRTAVLQQFPRINLGFNRAEDNTGVRTVGVLATIDLPVFDQNQGVIAAERATRQKLFDEYVSRVFQARSDIAMLVTDLNSLTAQIAAAEGALPAVRELVKTYELAVRQGNADVLSYYTARNDLAQKEIGMLKLKQQLVDEQIALELAAGRCLPQPPTTQPSSQPATSEVQR